MSLRQIFVLLWAACMTLAGERVVAQAGSESPAPEAAGVVVLLRIHDAIGPATSDYFVRALEQAAERKARLLVVELDTPGGLDTAMRDMIQAVLASPVPVVTYVAPSGARAASAGTYLLYASHVAAMAPATNVGAATPVNMMGSEPQKPAPGDKEKTDATQDSDGSAPGSAMERKAVNDAVAYIRGLAELRGRNVEWAESAVRSAASLSSAAALEQKVIDVVADDVADLLRQIDGRTVKLPTGDIQLATQGLVVERLQPDWRTDFLAVLTNPNIAYLLMLIGIYGLLLEGYNPGAILPGVVGAICLLMALFAFQVLSVNYAGLALILLGVILIVAESFVPSFGALGIGGVIAFVIGSILLMDGNAPQFQIARPLLAAFALAGALVAMGIALFAMRSRQRPIVTGQEQMLDETAVALSDFDREGLVRVHGELWNATSTAPVKANQPLRVLRMEGLKLTVEPKHV